MLFQSLSKTIIATRLNFVNGCFLFIILSESIGKKDLVLTILLLQQHHPHHSQQGPPPPQHLQHPRPPSIVHQQHHQGPPTQHSNAYPSSHGLPQHYGQSGPGPSGQHPAEINQYYAHPSPYSTSSATGPYSSAGERTFSFQTPETKDHRD